MPTCGSVVPSLKTWMNSCYGVPQPPWHIHCGHTNYEYSWSRSVFPKMFSVNKLLRLFLTSRGNRTYVSEGKTKCQLVARGDKENIANCRRKASAIFRVTFGNFSDTSKFIFSITQSLAETIVMLCGILTGKHLKYTSGVWANLVLLATGDNFLSQNSPATSGSWLPQKRITPVIYWKLQVSESAQLAYITAITLWSN
jgi:hypothetical protein